MSSERMPTGTACALEVQGPACAEHLCIVRQRVEDHLVRELGDRVRDFPLEEVMLALQEAIANVARHAYPEGQPGPLEVRVEVDPATVRILVRDEGPGYDPATVPLPREDPPTPGGYGLMLMQSIMSRFDYRRREGHNELRMERDLPAGED